MPEINFNEIEDIENNDYTPLPDGKYRVVLDGIEEKISTNGNEMWALTFVVSQNLYHGKKVFDNMVFKSNILYRVKLICKALGIDVSKTHNLRPESILGKECIIETTIEEYTSKTGDKKKKNVIPFAGYFPLFENGNTPTNPVYNSIQNDNGAITSQKAEGNDSSNLDDIPF